MILPESTWHATLCGVPYPSKSWCSCFTSEFLKVQVLKNWVPKLYSYSECSSIWQIFLLQILYNIKCTLYKIETRRTWQLKQRGTLDYTDTPILSTINRFFIWQTRSPRLSAFSRGRMLFLASSLTAPLVNLGQASMKGRRHCVTFPEIQGPGFEQTHFLCCQRAEQWSSSHSLIIWFAGSSFKFLHPHISGSSITCTSTFNVANTLNLMHLRVTYGPHFTHLNTIFIKRALLLVALTAWERW